MKLLAAALSLAVAMSAAADEAPGPALSRGVNLSNWFTDAQREPLVAGDFQRIKAAGLDFVRIPINPELLGFSLFDARDGRVLFDFTNVDHAVNMAHDNGLTVILDIQPSASFLSQVEQDPPAERAFVSLWGHIAEHYKTYPKDGVALEIMGEPQYLSTPDQYRTLISDVVAAIRRNLPSATIVIDTPNGASIDGFRNFAPLEGADLVYAFHFYEPYLFTHQGMRASASRGYAIRYFHNLPYPSALVDPNMNYAPSASDPIEAKTSLADYVNANWDAGHIASRIALAAEWANTNRRRVLCGEFGVVRKYAPADSRYKWIADTRKALEADHIGWAISDYADAFGITELNGDTVVEGADGSVRLADPQQGFHEIEPDARQALFAP